MSQFLTSRNMQAALATTTPTTPKESMIDLYAGTKSTQVMSGHMHYSTDASEAVMLASPITITMNKESVDTSICHRIAPRSTVAAPVTGATVAAALGGNNLSIRYANAVARANTRTFNEACEYDEGYYTKMSGRISSLNKSVIGKGYNFDSIFYAAGITMAAAAQYNTALNVDDMWGIFNVPVAERLPPYVSGKNVVVNASTKCVHFTKDAYTLLGPNALTIINIWAVQSGSATYVDDVSYNDDGTMHTAPPIYPVNRIAEVVTALLKIAEDNNTYCRALMCLTLGFNQVCTVIGETYEGANGRSLLRNCAFGAASGVIHTEDVVCLSRVGNTLSEMRAYIYARLLMLAAAYTCADPMVPMENKVPMHSMFAFDEADLQTIAAQPNQFTAWLSSEEGEKIIATEVDIVEGCIRAVAAVKDVVRRDRAAANAVASYVTVLLESANINNYDDATITVADYCHVINILRRHIASSAIFLWAQQAAVNFAAVNAVLHPGLGADVAIAGIIGAHSVTSYDPTEYMVFLQRVLVHQNGITHFVNAFGSALGCQDTTGSLVRMIQLCLNNYIARVLATWNYGGGVAYDHRHFSQPLVFPFSWIEASGLIPTTCTVPAVVNGYVLTSMNGTTSYKAFDGEFSADNHTSIVKFNVKGSHSARNLHFLNFYRNHIKDGIGGIYTGTLNSGNSVLTTEEIGDGSHFNMSQVTWSLGSGAPFPHFGEYVAIDSSTQYYYAVTKTILNLRNGNYIPKTVRSHMYSPCQSLSDSDTYGVLRVTPPDVTYSQAPFMCYKAHAFRGSGRNSDCSTRKLDRIRAIIEYTGNSRTATPDFLVSVDRYTNATYHMVEAEANTATAQRGVASGGGDSDSGSSDDSDNADDVSDDENVDPHSPTVRRKVVQHEQQQPKRRSNEKQTAIQDTLSSNDKAGVSPKANASFTTAPKQLPTSPQQVDSSARAAKDAKARKDTADFVKRTSGADAQDDKTSQQGGNLKPNKRQLNKQLRDVTQTLQDITHQQGLDGLHQEAPHPTVSSVVDDDGDVNEQDKDAQEKEDDNSGNK